MNPFKLLKKKWESWYYHDIDDESDEDWDEDEGLSWDTDFVDDEKSDAFFNDDDQRTVYVLECLGQMAEASDKMEQCDAEYEAVTSLLVDMEEIESLSNEIRADIMNTAQKIEMLEKERRRIYGKTVKLSEHEVALMERLEEDIPEGINKIKEAEDYRRLVKLDLRRLQKERDAYHFKRRELTNIIVNSRGVAFITAVAMVMCIVMLLLLQIYLEMDVRIGYLMACSIGAIALTVLYVRYIESISELEKLSKSINKLISVHNTVKIRYINNTNLLSYLYMKFDTESSEDLERRWKIFVEEINARQKDEKLKEDLEYYYNKLTKILSNNNIKDPDIWTHQARALYDHREAVEVRHALIARRQKLREQMEYNKRIAVGSKDKIATLAKRYPEYSSEISEIVKRYEGVN